MKTLFNKLNKFGLLAIVIALLTIGSQSAFTSNVAEAEYGFFNGVWYNLANTPPSGFQYDCAPSTSVCTQIYEDGAPDQGGTYVRDEQLDGTFRLIPD